MKPQKQPKRRRALFSTINLLGDSLNITQSLAEWWLHNQDYEIHLYAQNQEFCRLFEGLPFLTDLQFRDDWEEIRFPHKHFKGFDFYHNFNISVAFSIGSGNGLHMAESFGLALESSPNSNKPTRVTNLIPLIDKIEGIDSFNDEESIIISPFSTSSDPTTASFRSSKMLGFDVWNSVLDYLTDKYGWKVKVLGTAKDPWDVWEKYCGKESADVKYYIDRPIRQIAARIISKGVKCCLTVDNGIGHLMGSVMFRYNRQIPTIFIMGQTPIQWIYPHGLKKSVIVRCEPRKIDYSKLTEKKVMEQLDVVIKKHNEKGNE